HILDLDMRMYWHGQHVLHSRYKDAQDVYSLVTTDTIVKQPLPYTLFDMNASEICPGESVDFSNNSVDYDTVLWDFGDGTTSTDINPTHIFNQSGTYQINLHITETSTGQTADLQQTLTVNPLPASSVSSSNTFPACFGETVTLTADASGMNYLWSTGETSQRIDVGNAGTFWVQITDPNTNCQTTSDDVIISFYPQIDDTIIFDQSNQTLHAVQDNATYQWLDCNDNYAPILGETSQYFSPSDSGMYAVEVIQNDCNIISNCIDVTINSIADDYLTEIIKIYPNPVSNQLIINHKTPIQIALIDIKGRIFCVFNYNDTQTRAIDMSAYAKGIYIARVRVFDNLNKVHWLNYKIIKK
ncbi:MAG TPA: T9SS type A sorting domain-containing protein, partial [Flavobacteriales bacterium]|nr:T9SS type A sorting domain-containing protein [Flavobacteriales bacterium]